MTAFTSRAEKIKGNLLGASREDTLSEFAGHEVLYMTENKRGLFHKMLDLRPLCICQRNLGAELRVVDLTDACIFFEVHAIQAAELVACFIIGLLVLPCFPRVQNFG